MQTFLLCGLNPSGCCTNLRVRCDQRIGSCRQLRPGARGDEPGRPKHTGPGSGPGAGSRVVGHAAARLLPYDGGWMPTQEPSRQFQPGRIHRKAWSTSGINRHDPGPTSHGLRFPSRGCVARPELLPEDSFQPLCSRISRCAAVQDLHCTLIKRVLASRQVRQQRHSVGGPRGVRCAVPDEGCRVRSAGKAPTGPSRLLDKASGSPEEAEKCGRNSTPAGAPGDQACLARRHAHGAWLQLDAATGLQQNVGGHGTRLPGWGGCVSGPRFPLPGSRQTDRHNHVPNAESGTWVQAGERGERQVSGGVEGRRHPQSEAVPVSFRDQTPTRGLQQCDRDYMLPVAPTPDHRPHHGPRPFPRQGRRHPRKSAPGLRRRLCPDLRPRPHRDLC